MGMLTNNGLIWIFYESLHLLSMMALIALSVRDIAHVTFIIVYV